MSGPMINSKTRAERRPLKPGVASARFTWIFIALSSWLMGGAYLDAWAHHNLKGLESFFTPYHFLLYSGMTAIGIFLSINVARNFRRYGTREDLLPDGYGVSLLGTVLFGIGGGLDLVWHAIFGFEVSVAALFSPTHLLLMLAGGLIVSGPLRADIRRGGTRASWAGIVSGALTLSMFTFFAQFDQPLIQRWAGGASAAVSGPYWMQEELGMLGIMLYAIMVAGLLVLLLRRFVLPIGSATVILVINSLLVSPVEKHLEMVVGALLGGLAGDLLLYLLRPSPNRPRAFHVFAFAAPAAMTTFYLLFLEATTGIWWQIHFWAGAVLVAGMMGWLVSFVALPGDAARARIAAPESAPAAP